MLDFIFKMEATFSDWLPHTKWNFSQLAEKSGETLDHVVDVLSDVLGVEFELNATIHREEVERAVALLKERMRPQIEAHQRILKQRQDKAVKSYDGAMEKIRVLQQAKNWPNAYRTVSTFIGTCETDLPKDILLSLYGEALRLGIKSNENLQELGRWLSKAVAICCNPPNKDGLEEALDFIDAYGEYFYNDTNSNGRKFISNLLKTLREPVGEFGLSGNYMQVIKGLGGDLRA
ncbi:MAG: hypothetical protein KBD78_00225 [Oligoflexales bacterium]|nr:hypothetical protein [Oligoflexales bacterium]